MSDVKYDSEKLKKDAQDFMDSFRLSMKKIAEETLGELYVNIMPYAETDSWTNYREALRLELEHEYKYSKFKNEWARDFRRAVFVENREEISKLIEKDILERIKHLEDIKQEYDMFRYSPGGDRYQDKVNENTKLQAALDVAKAFVERMASQNSDICLKKSAIEDLSKIEELLSSPAVPNQHRPTEGDVK